VIQAEQFAWNVKPTNKQYPGFLYLIAIKSQSASHPFKFEKNQAQGAFKFII